jgi:hypothetical protein
MPMSATTWQVWQRCDDTPRKALWQAKQSVAISAWAGTTGPGLIIKCGNTKTRAMSTIRLAAMTDNTPDRFISSPRK